jgi:hypothetical protein
LLLGERQELRPKFALDLALKRNAGRASRRPASQGNPGHHTQRISWSDEMSVSVEINVSVSVEINRKLARLRSSESVKTPVKRFVMWLFAWHLIKPCSTQWIVDRLKLHER